MVVFAPKKRTKLAKKIIVKWIDLLGRFFGRKNQFNLAFQSVAPSRMIYIRLFHHPNNKNIAQQCAKLYLEARHGDGGPSR